jgi:hypothetical protein
MLKNVFDPLSLATLVLSVTLAAAPSSSEAAFGGGHTFLHHPPHRFQRIADRNSFRIEPVSGQSGRPIPIVVTLPADLPNAADGPRGPVFLLFHGIPAEISFSVGFRIKGNWAVGVSDLGKLALLSKTGYAASFQVQAMLHLGADRPPLEQKLTIEIRATEPPPQPATTAAIVGNKPSEAAKPATMSPPEMLELLRRADRLLQTGDIESARLIYAELASHGNATAAVLMARTYDPDVLKKSFIVGLTPDAQQAQSWYLRAMELGEITAKQHFDRLSARH